MLSRPPKDFMARLAVKWALLTAAPLFLLGASGCKTSAAAPAEATADAAGEAAVEVKTAPAKLQRVPDYLLATGQLRGNQEADVAANAAGKVLSTSVERGSEVKKGAILAQLDTRTANLSAAEASANARTAAANAERAKADCARGKSLAESGTISAQEWERMETACRTTELGVAAAQARAAMASQAVGDGAIRAPFAGVITERYIDTGEYVRPDSRVVTLVELDKLRLELTIPEAQMGRLAQGARVEFTVAAYPDRTFEGKVRFVGGAVRTATRDVLAEAEVDNKERALRPGMFAMVRLSIGEAPRVVVPVSSTIQRDGKDRVYVVHEGLAEERVVALGDKLNDVVVVTRGVSEGDLVVLSPPEDLRNGQPVR